MSYSCCCVFRPGNACPTWSKMIKKKYFKIIKKILLSSCIRYHFQPCDHMHKHGFVGWNTQQAVPQTIKLRLELKWDKLKWNLTHTNDSNLNCEGHDTISTNICSTLFYITNFFWLFMFFTFWLDQILFQIIAGKMF